eukprot:COSAG01_NODE_11139_length_1998_cov_1.546077_1_plen_229_part_00
MCVRSALARANALAPPDHPPVVAGSPAACCVCCKLSNDGIAHARLGLCGNPGGPDGLAAELRTHNWGVHSPPASMRLAQPQCWQHVDLERSPSAAEAGAQMAVPHLRFELSREAAAECEGFMFSSRFFFHDDHDVLDTLRDPTHWGTLFVPFDLGLTRGLAGVADEGAFSVELRTELTRDSQAREHHGGEKPSKFELLARATCNGAPSTWKQCAASIRTGLAAHEHFM